MFARKLVRPFGMTSQADLLNEIRALDKLCIGDNRNIVKVFKHGSLTTSPYYYIDMELCDLSLTQYLSDDLRDLISDHKRVPFEIGHVWGIMKDATCGLEFIHSHNEVHRDLKPGNGMPLRILNKFSKTTSAIFT